MTFDLEQALRRYRADEFFDNDVTDCAGLSVRGWRELIKLKAVQTTSELGRGRGRKCDQKTFKRAAAIAAFHQAGFSLPVAGRLAYLIPFDHIIYANCDPIAILCNPERKMDSTTALPPRREKPKVDWFDPDKPSNVDPKYDWYVHIYDGRFVALGYRTPKEPFLYGDLRDNQTRFVAWYRFHGQGLIFDELRNEFVGGPVAKWDPRAEGANQIDLKFLGYEYEIHDAKGDPLRLAALAAAQSPVSKTSINISFAVRTAIRRYLRIDPKLPTRSENSI